jgi:hypothetical protein
MKLFVEVSIAETFPEAGGRPATKSYYLVEAENHKEAIMKAMIKEGRIQPEASWPFDNTWEEMVEEGGECEGAHYYCGYYCGRGEWTYDFTIREATEVDNKSVNEIETLKQRLQEWSDKTINWGVRETTREYGSYNTTAIIAHCLADCRVERMSKKELVYHLYRIGESIDSLSEDQIAEACLKEIGDIDTIINRVDKFFRTEHPQAVKD